MPNNEDYELSTDAFAFEGHGTDHESIVGENFCKTVEEELRGEIGASPKVVFIRYPNGGYRAVSPKEAAKYNSLPLAAKKLYQARYDPTCANVSGKPPAYYRMVQTPGGITLRMAAHLADQWKALSPAQQRSLLWRATRNRGTTEGRSLPCR